ncbi:MAG: energy-coupling factor transporter transmembrane component T [Desulfurococcaceae archaeon TW002]
MNSAVVRRFLEATSQTLEIIDLRGYGEVSPVFIVMSLIIIILTSFTTNLYVAILTLITSAVILITHGSRNYLRRLSSALVYVFLFSLLALLPFLIKGSVSLYFLYVLRAMSAASFLLAMTIVLGWKGLSDFMRELRLPDIALLLLVHIKIIVVLLRDTSKILLSREARLISDNSIGSLPTHITVIGDLILRSSERSRRALLAVEARTFGEASDQLSFRKSLRLSKLDMLASLVASIELLICLISEKPW